MNAYPHMCRNEHQEIGHADSEHEMCPLCRANAATEAAQEALEQILAWAEAYPIEVFPEPDWKRSAEVLKAAGLSLDRISASNMRHVITRVAELARATVKATGGHP